MEPTCTLIGKNPIRVHVLEKRIPVLKGIGERAPIAHTQETRWAHADNWPLVERDRSDFVVEAGDRIAQMTFAPVFPVRLEAGQVEMTGRGGFGSTGVA